MQGLELKVAPADVVRAAQSRGLLVISAGSNVLRLVPPLVIEKSHVEEMKSILMDVFSQLKA